MSRPGKSTIAQYLCFSNGLPMATVFPNGYDESKLPLELLQEKLKTELKGINKDVIGDYFARLNEEYKQTLDSDVKERVVGGNMGVDVDSKFKTMQADGKPKR